MKLFCKWMVLIAIIQSGDKKSIDEGDIPLELLTSRHALNEIYKMLAQRNNDSLEL